jgi:glycosyltransferase involved in cell wall biosynthesis
VEALSAAAGQALLRGNELSIQARQQAEMHLDIQVMTNRYLAALNLPPQASQSNASPERQTLRQQAARWTARPRFYGAVALRKVRQAQHRLFPPAPNTRPRIAFTLYDFHVGGIENWLYRLASELNQEFDFYFLATKVPEFLPKFGRIGKCEFLPSPMKMTAYLSQQHIDLVQVHNERWPVDAALAAGAPHIIERLGGPRSWRRVPKYGLEMVIASAHMAAEAISDMIPKEKIRVIYNGIDLQQVDASSRQRLFPEDTFVVGRSSRFGQGQNLGMLVQAIEQLHPRLPQLRLVLVGGDSQMPGATPVAEQLRHRVQAAGLAEYVHFTGVVEDPLPYTHGFDIGACVSKDEGIPNSLIEALACRKAVIATRVGAIPELIQHEKNGMLIESGDLQGLCAAIEQLARDSSLRQRLAQAGRRTVEEKFSLPQVASQYAAVYRQVLGG